MNEENIEIQNFKQNEFNKNNYTIISRPGQILKDHILSMILEFAHHLTKNDCINKSTILSILFHDFGKLNLRFQYKISKNKKLSERNQELSYHSQTSVYFIHLFFKALQKIENKIEIDQISKISRFAILNHHFTELNDFGMISESKQKLKQDIYEITRDLLQNEKLHHVLNQHIDDIYTIILQLKQKINEERISVSEDVIKFINLLSKKELFGEYKKIIEIDLQDNSELQKEKGKALKFNSLDEFSDRDYFLYIYTSSILCNLDVWDASRYSENGIFNDKPFDITFSNIDNSQIINNTILNLMNIFQSKIDQKSEYEKILFETRKQLYNTIHFNPFSELNKIYTIDAPTGSGKTLALLYASSKIENIYKEKHNINPKIYYILPFVSICTQIGNVICDIFNIQKESNDILIYDNYIKELFNENKEKNDYNNYIDFEREQWKKQTFQSKFIVTTHIKFFNSIFKLYKHNFMNIHRFSNSIIIFDELQTIPIKYYDIIYTLLNFLTSELNCTILFASATLPIPNINNIHDKIIHVSNSLLQKKYQNSTLSELLNRYRLNYIGERDNDEIGDMIINNNDDNKDTMIILNTKKCVRQMYEYIKKHTNKYNIMMMNTNLTSTDKFKKIEYIIQELKSHTNPKPLLVITTQLIEAGVDISFPIVYRDFAPLDSLIQSSGRCNRNFENGNNGEVIVFKLLDSENPKNEYYYQYIYTCLVSIEETEKLLESQQNSISESNLRKLIPLYYNRIMKRKNSDPNEIKNDMLHLQFSVITKKFELIDYIEDNIHVLLLTDEKSIKLHNKMIDKKKIYNGFYLYSITTKKENIQKNSDFGIVKNKYDDVLYYYLKPEKTKDYYNEEVGFFLHKK